MFYWGRVSDLMALIIPYDLYYLYAAGKVAISGGDPYDYSQFCTALYQLGWPRYEGIQGLTHPPWNFWLYGMFAYLPFHLAAALWLSVIVIGICSALIWLHRSNIGVLHQTSQLSGHRLLLAIICFPPVYSNIIYGQINIFLLIGLLQFVRLRQLGRFFASGMWLSLTLLKPHLLIPLYVAIFITSFRERNFRSLLGCAVGFVLQLSLTLFFYPHALSDYVVHFSEVMKSTEGLLGASLAQVISFAFKTTWSTWAILATGTLISCIISARRPMTPFLIMHIFVPLSLLSTPYIWSHSMILMVASYLELVGALFSKMKDRARWVLLLLGIFSSVLVVRPVLDPIMIAFPILAVSYGISLSKKEVLSRQ